MNQQTVLVLPGFILQQKDYVGLIQKHWYPTQHCLVIKYSENQQLLTIVYTVVNNWAKRLLQRLIRVSDAIALFPKHLSHLPFIDG